MRHCSHVDFGVCKRCLHPMEEHKMLRPPIGKWILEVNGELYRPENRKESEIIAMGKLLSHHNRVWLITPDGVKLDPHLRSAINV